MYVIYLFALAIASGAIVVYEVSLLMVGASSGVGWLTIAPLGGAALCAFLVFSIFFEIRSRNAPVHQISGWSGELIAFMLTWVAYFSLILFVSLLFGLLPGPIVQYATHGELSVSELAPLAIKLGRASVMGSLTLAVIMYAATKLGWLNRDA